MCMLPAPRMPMVHLPQQFICTKGALLLSTEASMPHQIPLPDTSDSDDETLFDHVDSNVFDTYNAPETGSEASLSNSVNIDVTPNNQLLMSKNYKQALGALVLDCGYAGLKFMSVEGLDVGILWRKVIVREAGIDFEASFAQMIEFRSDQDSSLLTQSNQPEGFVDLRESIDVVPTSRKLFMDSNKSFSVLCLVLDSMHTHRHSNGERPNLDEDKGESSLILHDFVAKHTEMHLMLKAESIEKYRHLTTEANTSPYQAVVLKSLDAFSTPRTRICVQTKFRCIGHQSAIALCCNLVQPIALHAIISVPLIQRAGFLKGNWSNGHTVADSIGERSKQPTAYKFKTDCSIIPVWARGEMLYHQGIRMNVLPGLRTARPLSEVDFPDKYLFTRILQQVSKILLKIEKTVNEQLEAEDLTRSSNKSKTSHAIAANLSELKLKKILIDKMESNKHHDWLLETNKTSNSVHDLGNKTFTCVMDNSTLRISSLVGRSILVTRLMSDGYSLDFSAIGMNRLKVDTLTLGLLAGPTFKLMEGSCKSLVELEYFLKEVYKATTDQLNWNNPEGQQYPHDMRKLLPLIPNS
ncbi:hypothetical protein Tco_0393182 [Tanacetum coccineum]